MQTPDATGYVNFWGKDKPKFTEMEIALMEGGHSLTKPSTMEFIKSLSVNTLQKPPAKPISQ